MAADMALADPRGCACGSGLKHAGCCGLNLAALDRSPPDAPLLALMARAQQACEQGDAALAERLCVEGL